MNVLRALKITGKKTVFALVISGYAVNQFKTRIQIFQYMTLLSNELQNSSSVSTNSSKRVLVVLNPIANKRKSEKIGYYKIGQMFVTHGRRSFRPHKFKKYCEPLLHLAGYKVEIFRTNHIGHAKSFIEEITNLPDVVVVAGGEGTTSEVVTGLLRRTGDLCPLTLLPLGRKSESPSINFAITGNDLDSVKSLTSALLPLLKNQFEYKSVIQCDVLSNYDNINEQSANRLKPIFGLNRFSWGILKNIDSSKDKYWYFGPVKHYVAALLTSTSNKSNWSFEIAYEYTPPCPGCRNCAVLNRPMAPTPAVNDSGSFFIRKLVTPKIEPSSQKFSKKHILNNNCSTQIKGKIEANDLTIACSQNKENFVELESKFINSLHPGWDFIKNIPNIAISNIQPSLVLKSRTIQLYPSSPKASLLYSIDGEEYDARPIKISVVPNAIKVFC